MKLLSDSECFICMLVTYNNLAAGIGVKEICL